MVAVEILPYTDLKRRILKLSYNIQCFLVVLTRRRGVDRIEPVSRQTYSYSVFPIYDLECVEDVGRQRGEMFSDRRPTSRHYSAIANPMGCSETSFHLLPQLIYTSSQFLVDRYKLIIGIVDGLMRRIGSDPIKSKFFFVTDEP